MKNLNKMKINILQVGISLVIGSLLTVGVFYFFLKNNLVINSTSHSNSTSPILPSKMDTLDSSPSRIPSNSNYEESDKEATASLWGISYSLPPGWRRFSNANNKEINLSDPIPPINEVATDLQGCVFYVGQDYGRGGPTEFLTNEDVMLNNIPFIKRSWSESEKGTPFFSYYFPKEGLPYKFSETIYTWMPKTNYTQCQSNISAILNSIKFGNPK